MAEIQLGNIEAKFAEMIWKNEPVSSSELVKMAAVEFEWKRTTTHTVLRRLIDKGLFQNEKGTVTSLISKQEFYAMQSRKIVDDSFHGSLPAFIAAFASNKKLSKSEVDEIQKMIDDFREEQTEESI